MTAVIIEKRNNSRLFGNRSGQAGLFVALNLSVVFGVLGFAVDLGWGYFTKMRAQSAADAAAMAAATYAANGGPITCGAHNVTCAVEAPCAYPNVSPPTDDLTTGCLYAAANGFVNNGDQKVLISGNTTSSGISGNAPTYWVKATVSENPHTLFGSFGGMNQFTVSASSTAAVAYYSAGACIYVLDPAANGAFTTAGSTSVVATCGIFVNSNHPNAFTAKGGAVVTASQILVNGGSQIANNASVAPTPTTNAGSQNDPLATMSLPSFTSGCDYTNYTASSGATVTLSPGTYCGGLNFNGANVTFTSGLYILNGGGMSISGNGTITGSDVTFFNTGQYGHTIGAITMTGSALTTLSAPHSGAQKGMLFLQDRNLTYGASNKLAGTSGSTFTGTLYFPTTDVQYTGTTASGTYTALIAKTLTFTGTSDFVNDVSGFYTGLGTTVRGVIQ
jgi:hypothetical protein